MKNKTIINRLYIIVELLVLCLLMISCDDTNTFKFDGIRYNVLPDSTVEVVADDSYQNFNSISIPEKIKKDGIEYNVSCIGAFAFKDCKRLVSIVIPNTITKIRAGAFYGCNGMMSINIPDNVTFIDNLAFTYCSSLTNMKIPSSVRILGDEAFAFCERLNNVELPSSIRTIGKMTFTQCKSLMKVEIPDSVMKIGTYAFAGCESLRSIEIPTSVAEIEDYAFLYCSNLDVVIYNTEENIKIGKYALQGCNSVTFKKKKKNNALNITESSDVIDVTTSALKFKVLSKSTVEVINDDSYWDLRIVNIPSKVNIRGHVYSVISIGNSAFYNCGSKSITLPPTIEKIGEAAFSDSELLKSINVSSENPNFTSENGILYNKKKTKIIAVPGGLQGNFEVSSSVTTIGEHAFHGCRFLKSIKIPNCVKSIGKRAFEACKSLESINVPNGIKCIDYGTFWACSELKKIELPSSVTSIGDGAFMCSGIEKIKIPYGVTRIESSAFFTCHELTYIEIPSTVTSIGKSAFLECENLIDIDIPLSVVSIEDHAFQGCTKLKNIIIPSSVNSIGTWAFGMCENLSVEIDNSENNVELGKNAFYKCNSIVYNK